MRKSFRADLALTFCAAVWGLTFVMVKGAVTEISPILFVGLRFALASVLLAPFLGGKLSKLRLPGFAAGAALGGCLFLGFSFQTFGLVYTTPSKSAFLTGLSVLLVPWLAVVFTRRTPRIESIAGVFTATAGLWLLTSPSGGDLNPGDIMTVFCAFFFGLHIVLVERFVKRYDFQGLVMVQTVACGAAALVGSPFIGRLRFNPGADFILALAVTALFATAVAFYIQNRFQRDTTSTRTALIFATEPVFAALFEFFLEDTVLGGAAMTGAALILAGIIITEAGAALRKGIIS